MSLQEVCLNYIVRHLGRFPCDALKRLPNLMRYRLLMGLPAIIVWRLEATSFVQGLEMETVWRQLLDERVSLFADFSNGRWSCSKGTERCLNLSHDRGIMNPIGYPFLFHDCVVFGSSENPSQLFHVIQLSSRSLYFLYLWKALYSATSYSDNQKLLTDMLFSPLCHSEIRNATSQLLFDIVRVPESLVLPQHNAAPSSTPYVSYVNTLTSFLALECHVRPSILYINPSYSFLNQQSAIVLQELLKNINTLSFEYSSGYKCVLEAALRNHGHLLLMAIRGKGAAADVLQLARDQGNLRIEYSFNGRYNSEPDLSELVNDFNRLIVSLDVRFHSSPDPSYALADQFIAVVQKPHIRRVSLDGVLNSNYAKQAVIAFLTAPCDGPQRLELKKVHSSAAAYKTQRDFLVHQDSNGYWKLKSLCINSDSGEFSSWVLGLSHCRIFSLEIFDFAADFDCKMFCQPIRVERFHLSISVRHKTVDSLELTKILKAVASECLQYVCLDLNCKMSLGVSSIVRSLTEFLKEHSRTGFLFKLHVHIQGFGDIDNGDVHAFFGTLFNLPSVSMLDFKFGGRNCHCDHSSVLAAWRHAQTHLGARPPQSFYFHTSDTEWKEIPSVITVPCLPHGLSIDT